MNKTCLLYGLILLGSLQSLLAQEKSAQTDYRYGKYLGMAALADYQSNRDLGVSPLTYRGFLFGGMGELGFEGKRWDISIDGGVGVGDSKVKKVATFAAESTVFYYNGRFLYKFWDKNEGNLDFRAGLQLGGYSAQRVTPAFLNASLVWESINTLFATAKVNWRISHTQTAGRFLFIRRNAGIRHVKFSSQLSLPLLHSVWRPGYAYIEDFSDGDANIYANNKLDFGGIRFQWRTDGYYYLLNGNALRLTYLWDAQRSPGEINRLELGHHQLLFGLLFRLN